MAKRFSFGPFLAVSKEADEQYAIADEAIDKLADMTGIGWHFMSDTCYKREMSLSALSGGIATGAIIGSIIIAKNFGKTRKQLKQDTDKK